jgi:hypothetical protein
MLSPDHVRELLLRLPGLNMDEIYHVTTFRCYRRSRETSMQEVIVEILDMGPNAQADLRYSCHASTEDGRFATGNPGKTIDEALAIVHWGDLDRPPQAGTPPHWR